MDFDVSTPSVTEALGDLQLRMQSLQEDRELYRALEEKACTNFERHRAELTLLLQKERAIHAAAEDRLRRELQQLLAENETTRIQLARQRKEQQTQMREELLLRQEQLEKNEAEMMGKLSELREQYNAERTETDLAQQEKMWHELQLREVLDRQRTLNTKHQQLVREMEEIQKEQEQQQQRDKRGGGGSCGRRHSPSFFIEKVFLPSGPPDQCHTTTPSSHHIAAIVSTVERQNCYKPRTYYRRHGVISPMDVRLGSPTLVKNAFEMRRPPPLLTNLSSSSLLPGEMVTTTTKRGGCGHESFSRKEGIIPLQRLTVNSSTATGGSGRVVTNSARHLSALCRSLLREILQLRKEYREYTTALNDPSVDSVEVSRRMRSIMTDLDRKVHQLRSLRQQQAQVEDKLRLHDVLMEIAAENNYCEAIYSDLLELIRS
ncbi:uncharacterized protein TM35_000241860 [Trypanosoma theileri]|uniref:Uncharacterized protein n=1 Tax=Trypanosoma theileri TaxID=67003 RepID=A0A1X0NQP4_9TRYP|nr:uncharacterized protein TM35_000241860 [Trypanosoma theileri]ORC87036.1 hypothetical protein TM35_000241860 [Trypanosoma theileri]